MSDRPHRSMDDYALLAEEAEHGELRPAPGTAEVSSDYAMLRGRPRDGVPREASVSYTVRVPSGMGEALARYATEHHLTTSEVVRAALGVYLAEQPR